MITLRDYQERFVSQISASLREFDRVLGVMPTGGGKTICFSKIADDYSGRKLILAHREELIDQAVDKVEMVTGSRPSVEMGDRHREDTDIIVGSIQSLYRRKDELPRDYFDLIICDEAHYSLSKTWQDVLMYFNSKVLGVTATPFRGDDRNLGEFYESCPCDISMMELIDKGFLSKIFVKQFPIKIDIGKVRITDGDLDVNMLDDALDPYLKQIARELIPYRTRKILVFLPLIVTSQKFADLCRQEGLDAVHIDGTSNNRKEILNDFSEKDCGILCNSSLLSHGVDIPSIDSIMILRPTKSKPLYSQMCGRGTRIYPEKDYLLILDPMWLSEKHSLVNPVNLLCSDLIDVSLVEGQIEKLATVPVDLVDILIDVRAERERKIAEELERKANRKAKMIDIFQLATSIGKSLDIGTYMPVFKWEKDKVTDKQANLLLRFGISPASIENKGQAGKIIGYILDRQKAGLATPKQVVYAKRFGHAHAEMLTFKEATAYLSTRMGR